MFEGSIKLAFVNRLIVAGSSSIPKLLERNNSISGAFLGYVTSHTSLNSHCLISKHKNNNEKI